jgi:UMP-CMP kinase
MTVIGKVKEALHIGQKDSQATSSTSGAPASASGSHPAEVPSLPEKDVFDKSKVTVIFVLGGPGAGESSLRTR